MACGSSRDDSSARAPAPRGALLSSSVHHAVHGTHAYTGHSSLLVQRYIRSAGVLLCWAAAAGVCFLTGWLAGSTRL